MSYTHLFFDLDDTLWDSKRNSTEALHELFHKYTLDSTLGLTEEAFVEQFHTVNYGLWDKYSAGQITQTELRKQRFPLVFQALGITNIPDTAPMQDDYLAICPRKPHLMPHAIEVLDYLRPNYQLHIITNGFDDVQFIKMNCSGITHYFGEVVTAHQAGCQKPNRQIFDLARQRAKVDCPDCLMIGDNLLADIQGAKNAEMDHVFYNHVQVSHNSSPTYEVHCLRDLMQIL
jgi:putative hydrolase of the HAD superfamily